MNGKHAYLIMAHNQSELLKKLLTVLDNERNDIFLHVDKKSDLDLDDFSHCCKKSSIFFTDRINVYWGGGVRLRPN